MSYVYCTFLSFGDVLEPIGAADHHVGKGRFFLCPLAGYVHSSLPCLQLPWVQQYFRVGVADGRARPQPLPAPRPRLRPRSRP